MTPDESTAWADDLTHLGRDYFFSLNRYLFIASKQAPPWPRGGRSGQ